MAINALSFPVPQPFNTATADFSPLANLGNVYQQAQQGAMQQAALANLGNDPTANAQTLIKSGVPSLAQLGINLQSQQQARAEQIREYEAQQRIREAAETRAQETYEKSDADEAAAAAAIGKLFPAAPQAAPQTAFPSPGQPTMPANIASTPTQADTMTSPIAPSQLQTTGITDRIANNLTSAQPAAAAGISRDQIAELYRNPLTRPLATAFLQKQFDPGTWKYEKTDDGRIIATNANNPSLTRDVTPPTTSGQPPATKEQRERDARYADAKTRNLDDTTANYYAMTGKMPKEDLSATEEKRIGTLTDQVNTAQRTLTNIAQLKELSKNAWGFTGAGPASLAAATVLPDTLAKASGAVDTQDLINAAQTNVASVAKTIFPQRVTNTDLQLLKELESSANQPDSVRQRIYTRAEQMFTRMQNEATAEAEGIRNKTFYKPGGGPQPAAAAPAAQPTAAPAAAPAAPAAPAAKPSLQEFMSKARAANPGAKDSDLAQYWKQKYGG
jgi:hypothetical protein